MVPVSNWTYNEALRLCISSYIVTLGKSWRNFVNLILIITFYYTCVVYFKRQWLKKFKSELKFPNMYFINFIIHSSRKNYKKYFFYYFFNNIISRNKIKVDDFNWNLLTTFTKNKQKNPSLRNNLECTLPLY